MDFNYIDKNAYLEDFKRLMKTVITTSSKLIKSIKEKTGEEKQADLFYFAYVPLYDLMNYYPFIKRFLSKDFTTVFSEFVKEVELLFSGLHLKNDLAEKTEFLKKIEDAGNKKSFYSMVESAYDTFPEHVKMIEEIQLNK